MRSRVRLDCPSSSATKLAQIPSRWASHALARRRRPMTSLRRKIQQIARDPSGTGIRSEGIAGDIDLAARGGTGEIGRGEGEMMMNRERRQKNDEAATGQEISAQIVTRAVPRGGTVTTGSDMTGGGVLVGIEATSDPAAVITEIAATAHKVRENGRKSDQGDGQEIGGENEVPIIEDAEALRSDERLQGANILRY